MATRREREGNGVPPLFRRRRQTVWPSWYRRSPVLVVVVLAAAALAVVDRLGWLGTTGTDEQRYHNQLILVAKVVDGDTLHLAAPDGDSTTTRVRLIGVDCPEIAHGGRAAMYYGPEAAEFVRSEVLGKRVRVELDPFEPSRDKYDRLLAFVYLPGEDDSLNEKLLASGYAYAYRRFNHCRKDRFLQLEQRARREKAGLWAKITPEQMPQWRRALERDDE
jgi:endonuclease YncB( thermonuclease family)